MQVHTSGNMFYKSVNPSFRNYRGQAITQALQRYHLYGTKLVYGQVSCEWEWKDNFMSLYSIFMTNTCIIPFLCDQ